MASSGAIGFSISLRRRRGSFDDHGMTGMTGMTRITTSLEFGSHVANMVALALQRAKPPGARPFFTVQVFPDPTASRLCAVRVAFLGRTVEDERSREHLGRRFMDALREVLASGEGKFRGTTSRYYVDEERRLRGVPQGAVLAKRRLRTKVTERVLGIVGGMFGSTVERVVAYDATTYRGHEVFQRKVSLRLSLVEVYEDWAAMGELPMNVRPS
jgi:hypothetical protein